MKNHVDVAIIGAGSAGLSALRQVKKLTDNYLLIDPGPLGTTCARVGCMPSKALIHIAKNFHSRQTFSEMGISGSEHLQCDIPAALHHVRKLRDRFTSGMIKATKDLAGKQFIQKKATLIDSRHIKVEDTIIEADRIILATGSSPLIPGNLDSFSEHILTSATIFEQTDLPERLVVIGLGAIGLELGQALSRMGINITGFNRSDNIGGLSDPEVTAAAKDIFAKEFTIHTGVEAKIRAAQNGVEIYDDTKTEKVDKVLIAAGVRPNIENLGLENLGIELNEHGMPSIDPHTSQIGNLSVYLAGDANGYAPILHEALDEGFIAAKHSFKNTEKLCYCRRVPMRIVFSDPQCAVIGKPFADLRETDIVIGQIDFRDQARAILEGRNTGMLRLYAEASSGQLLGAEMVAPDAEHLAALLVTCIQSKMTIHKALQLPFYHPTLEEGLRTALRDAASKLPASISSDELHPCESCPEPVLQ